MFLLNRQQSGLQKYRIDIDDDLTSDILSMEMFYLTPDSVASYEFGEEEDLIARDNRVIPIYKFFCQLLNTDGNSRRHNLVYFSTDNTQNDFDCGSAKYNAIVNLSGGEYNNQIVFSLRNQLKEIIVEPETQDDENSLDQLAPGTNYQMVEEPEDKSKFISFQKDIEHNQVLIYDPEIFYMTSNMTKYQVFSIC